VSIRDLAPGTVIDGRYRIKNRIGSGGMADVYCATDEQLGRDVAVKLLHRRFAEDREFVERFRREASSAAGLQHPNVVGVYDRGEWDGTSYIAMEHLQGRTLKQLILEEAPLDPIRAIDLVVQVLRAARFAHKRGVIHRDLKPHNVIVDPEGRAKVTDFGIARAGASDMTQTGSIMGTAQYLSPEQAQGLPVDERSDLYSVGVVLYEMLTARVPFEGESAVSIALKQVSESPVPPSAINPSIPPQLEQLVLKALAKDPAERFQDADEMITALDRLRGHLAAGGAPSGEATTAFAPMPPPVVPVPVSPATATGAYQAAAATYPPEALDEEREHERKRWPLVLLGLLAVAAIALGAWLLLKPDQVAVPNVVGQPVQGARAALINAGFEVETERVRDAEAPLDTVIRQDPQPGRDADEGSTVTLTVSDGPGTETVPNVNGDRRNEAVEKLEDAGFKTEVRRESSESVAENRVIRTEPAAGALLEVGSTVRVVVSSGRERVEVPDLVGLEREEASSQLSDLGLRVTIEEEDSEEPEGTVLRQSPAAGTEVVTSSSVTLVVAREPREVEVPDVSGQPEGQAVNALSDAGFSPRTVDQTVDTPDQDGIVLDQEPQGGRQAERGSRVTITVGRFNPDLNPDPGAGDEEQSPPEDGGATP
jgi:serine/threonine-protein kinase